MQLKMDATAVRGALLDTGALRRLRDTKRKRPLTDGPQTGAEAELADWLGRLKLLHGIPFNYIVPNVDMLPMESIRFFYCDSIWLDYLQEGAMSLGRSTSGDQAHDEAFLPDMHHFSKFGARRQRHKVMGHLVMHMSEANRLKLQAPAPLPTKETVTGFLLRSDVLVGWEGLQVDAFLDDEQKQECRLLRMDHLGPNILLCTYEGEVRSIRIHEHPEVLHFGVDVSTAQQRTYSKSFRYPIDVTGHQAGTQVDPKVAVPVQIARFERSEGSGVIRINDMAGAMKDTLEKSINYTGSFTSAEFALEMVEGVEAVIFCLTQSKRS